MNLPVWLSNVLDGDGPLWTIVAAIGCVTVSAASIFGWHGQASR